VIDIGSPTDVPGASFPADASIEISGCPTTVPDDCCAIAGPTPAVVTRTITRIDVICVLDFIVFLRSTL